MAGRTSRVALAQVGVTALLGGIVALGPVAATVQADPLERPAGGSGACTDGKGITVVVDASAFGDGVQVRCAPQPVRSGFEALNRAGFTFQGTVRFPGLLCRIDGEPADQACHNAPPADAYWAYWHAPRGGSWTYSTSGAGTRVPPPGSVEGWAFGEKAEPGVDPPDPPPTTTTRPPTSTTRPTGGATDGGTTSPTGGATDGATATTGDAGTATSQPVDDGDAGDATTTSRGADARDSADEDDGASEELAGSTRPNDDGDAGGGSPAGLIVGVVTAAALTVAGLRIARRRSSDEGIA